MRIKELFLVCALAFTGSERGSIHLKNNKMWEYKFLAELAKEYGADQIIFRGTRIHEVPADSERMPFLWHGFRVYFKKSGWHLTKEEREKQFDLFVKYLKLNSPGYEFIFLEKGLPKGSGWKRVGLEWEGYRIFSRNA